MPEPEVGGGETLIVWEKQRMNCKHNTYGIYNYYAPHRLKDKSFTLQCRECGHRIEVYYESIIIVSGEKRI